ncbi:MAG: DUF1659 domain-containing protein [Parabacteroides sp.]|nr:DUF1659 domain-containing protein [Parabacteroides sp.]
MAITTTSVASEMVIVLDDGTGNDVSRRYSDVKPAATDADVYDVANGTAGLVNLQTKTLLSVQRRNTIEIENT